MPLPLKILNRLRLGRDLAARITPSSPDNLAWIYVCPVLDPNNGSIRRDNGEAQFVATGDKSPILEFFVRHLELPTEVIKDYQQGRRDEIGVPVIDERITPSDEDKLEVILERWLSDFLMLHVPSDVGYVFEYVRTSAPHVDTSDPRFYELRNAAERDLEVTAVLIEGDPTILEARNSLGETALHDLVIENQMVSAEWLLDRGADVNTRDDFGNTPLSSAALLGYLPMCQMLLRRGADLRTKDEDDDTPISKAARGDNIDVLKFLIGQLEEGEDVQELFDDITASMILRNDTPVTEFLKERGLVDPWGQ